MYFFLDAGHGGITIDGYYTTPGKRSPVPPPEGIYEGVFNRAVCDCILERGKDLMIQPTVNNSAIDHGITKRCEFINKTIDQKDSSYDPSCLISIHADAMGNGKEWTNDSGFKVLHYPGSFWGVEYGKIVLEEMSQVVPYKSMGLRPRSDVQILSSTRCPAILLECGHMTNLEDVKFLRTETGQQIIASAVVKAMYRIQKLGQ